jgi:hypothetical protein
MIQLAYEGNLNPGAALERLAVYTEHLSISFDGTPTASSYVSVAIMNDDPDIQAAVITEFSYHDPSLTESQLAALAAAEAEASAEAQIADIPGWATWTGDEALSWYDEHVVDPFSAATTAGELKAVMEKMIVAQRAIILLVIFFRYKLFKFIRRQ